MNEILFSSLNFVLVIFFLDFVSYFYLIFVSRNKQDNAQKIINKDQKFVTFFSDLKNIYIFFMLFC
jgi:hypothetical protein